MSVTYISRDEAKAAVERCAFTIPDDLEGAGRRIVHCILGGIGADWDAEGACDLIDQSITDGVAWIDHIFWGRCLAVVGGSPPLSRVHVFDTVKPEDQP